MPCYVHESKAGEIGEVAEQIITSKSFDYGTACVSEQAVIADREIARELRQEMKLRGAYFMTPAEADRLARVIFLGRQAMNPENVGQSPAVLAAKAEFSIPPRTRCLVSRGNRDRLAAAADGREAQSRCLPFTRRGIRTTASSCRTASPNSKAGAIRR